MTIEMSFGGGDKAKANRNSRQLRIELLTKDNKVGQRVLYLAPNAQRTAQNLRLTSKTTRVFAVCNSVGLECRLTYALFSTIDYYNKFRDAWKTKLPAYQTE